MMNEKGFMFLEAVVAVALSSIISLGAGMTIAQILKQSKFNEDYATVVRQAQNVGFSVSQDMLVATVVSNEDDVTTPDVEFITVNWKDWQSGYQYDVRYIWSNPADLLKTVIRQHIVYDGNGVEVSNTNLLLANNIYSANLTQPNDAWNLVVEARYGDMSAIREYEVNQRVE